MAGVNQQGNQRPNMNQRPPQQRQIQRAPQQRAPQYGAQQQRQMQGQGQMQQRPVSPQQRQAQQKPVSPQQRQAQAQAQKIQQNGYVNNNQYQQYPQESVQQQGVEDDIYYMKNWLLLLLKLFVPIWNIITIVKMFKTKYDNPVKYNFVVAYLIYFGASVVISLILSLLIAVL